MLDDQDSPPLFFLLVMFRYCPASENLGEVLCVSNCMPCDKKIEFGAESCDTSGRSAANRSKSGGIMEIVDKGADGCKSNKKCGLCTGDCDTDADCNDGLKCYQRLKGEDTVPGCKPSGFVTSSSPHDYCSSPTATRQRLTTPHTNMKTFATPSTSYNAAKRKCQELGSWGLCSRMQICPEYKGSNNAGQPVKHGNAGDVWIPVSDGIDQWVQGGNNKGDKRMCRLHSEWPDYQKDPHPCGKHPDPKTYPDEASWYGFFCLLRPPCLLTVYLMPPRIL